MLALLFFLPVVCWFLAARSRGIRIGLCLVLFALASAQFALVQGDLLPGKTHTLTIVLAIVVVGVLVCGWLLDGSQWSTRAMIGWTLTVGWCVFTVFAVALSILAFGVIGPAPTVAREDVLLPLPSGLVVSSNTTEPCGDSKTAMCAHIFEIRGSATTPDTAVLDAVLAHLRTVHGWSLEYDETSQVWVGHSTTGWLLDRQNVRVQVFGPWTGAAGHQPRLPRRRGLVTEQPPATVHFLSQ
ncbi:hypothetical protein AB0L82_38835 [Nocardia sp. NPDC052001]|uniref:hypothetical protein n=1 Tax=Nocardia sp. NPDC052001 TaxID=3154853 RepID=UPI003444A016